MSTTQIGTPAVACGCGGREGMHLIGDDGCRRELADAPTQLREEGDPWFEKWQVHGSLVTGYTLLFQRAYHHHRDGVWSRPRGGGSTNSLPDET